MNKKGEGGLHLQLIEKKIKKADGVSKNISENFSINPSWSKQKKIIRSLILNSQKRD